MVDIKISGRRVTVSDAMRTRVESKIGDALKVFDINLRQHWYSKEIIEGSLIRCNVLKLNDEEIVTVSELLGLGKVPSIL